MMEAMRRRLFVLGGLLFAMAICGCRPRENGAPDHSGSGAVHEDAADASANASGQGDAGKSTAGSCVSSDTCESGQVCWQQECTQTCTDDENCRPKSPTKTVCYDRACVIPCKTTRDCPYDTRCRRVPGRVLKGGVVYPSITACIAAQLGVDAETGEP